MYELRYSVISETGSLNFGSGIPWPRGGGGTDLERGYGDVRPWRPPFHASPAAPKGPISSKRVSSQDPLLRKFGNFSLNSLNFHPNFSSQAPKFGNFQLTSPQIWKFSAHKPPNLEIFRSQAPLFRGKCQFASPTLRKSVPHTRTWKKVECPPPGSLTLDVIIGQGFLICFWWQRAIDSWKKDIWGPDAHLCSIYVLLCILKLTKGQTTMIRGRGPDCGPRVCHLRRPVIGLPIVPN